MIKTTAKARKKRDVVPANAAVIIDAERRAIAKAMMRSRGEMGDTGSRHQPASETYPLAISGGMRTMPCLTQLEKAAILGARATQLEANAPPNVTVPFGMTDPMDVARLELASNAIPLKLARPLPDGTVDVVRVSALLHLDD
jgi:DNA-directed RNA polymerase subunit K/omega